MRHVFALAIAIAVSLLLLSCNASQPTAPSTGDPTGIPPVASLVTTARGSDLLVGYRIDVDEESLTATVTAHRAGAAQPPQAQRYDLDIANFQNADSFRITGVQVLGSGNFRITFSHAHPFPAPNIANPATGINRADLGYTGRVVILTSYNPKSFFSDTVLLSAGAVVAPDGYVAVGDLLANAAPAFVTAYPYRLLVDESLDTRIGISNGDVPTGTYDKDAGGWQRGNLGPAGTGWTGYDYLHGGQSTSNTITLDKDALAATNFSLDVALLIQYTDPRGAGGATFRLPPATVNSSDFAYRLPHAAIDCSKNSFTQNFALTSALDSSAPLTLYIRDWDASAGEAGDATLGDEGEEVDIVTAGASGAPEVVLDAPGILFGLRNMGTGVGTGLSDDPLTYANDVVNQLEAGPGEYYGCLRITDPEFNDPARDSFHAGVDATTLLPDGARAVPARTWQVVPITITQALQPPVISGVTPTGIIGAADEYVTFYAYTEGNADSFQWDFSEGGIRSGSSSIYKISTQLGGVAGNYSLVVTASNAAGESAPFVINYRILPPMRPTFAMSEITPTNLGLGESDDRMIEILNGKPIVFYTHLTTPGPTPNLWVAQAKNPTPNDPSDWDNYIVGPGAIGVISACYVNGRLAVACGTPNSSQLPVYAYALTDNPTGPTDWDSAPFVVPFGGEVWGSRLALVDYEGRPAALVIELLSDDLYFFRSATATPTAPGDWARHLVAMNPELFDLILVAAPEGPRLLATVIDVDTSTLGLFAAADPEPGATGDWTLATRSLSAVPRGVTALEGVPGEDALAHLAITFAAGELQYIGLQGDSVVTLAEFTSQVIPNAVSTPYSNLGPDLIRFNDRLALGYADADGERYAIARALRVNPQRSDWDVALLPTSGTGVRTDLIGVSNALCALVQYGDGNFYNYVQADGPW